VSLSVPRVPAVPIPRNWGHIGRNSRYQSGTSGFIAPRGSLRIEGKMGALLGDEELVAGPGDLIFKPRNQWHTFWNAGDEPARILEIIAPLDSSTSSRNLWTLVVSQRSSLKSWVNSAVATNWRWILKASPSSSSVSVCSFLASPSAEFRPSGRRPKLRS